MNAIVAGEFSTAHLSGGQKLAIKYFFVAMILFAAQCLFGLFAGLQYLLPDVGYNWLDFSVNRMVHINAMIVWMLYGFIGSVYWLVEEEAGTELVGLKLANLAFWVFTVAVTIVGRCPIIQICQADVLAIDSNDFISAISYVGDGEYYFLYGLVGLDGIYGHIMKQIDRLRLNGNTEYLLLSSIQANV